MADKNNKAIVEISKKLSLVLRHKPESIGLILDQQGWANVEMLIQKLNAIGIKLDSELLQQVVSDNNKSRFAYNDDKTRIRASQGHSIIVDLGYTAHVPPAVLYHGTGEQYISSILTEGILKMNRHHVHLSANVETAEQVAKRKGKPAILKIEAAKMYDEGFVFFISANNVWLTDYVPAEFISIN
ncbi:MAG TPA: RNA 2'-phosphotransferase [Segetibacter sp.]